ncbi:phosphopantetheine-binding protein, partial [Burkholderia cepacia]|uniref:phosphopantetheine-binding protein n=1 Tax=Burkholderia cepacia TaxID=292 RepID=UPI000A956B89
TELQDRLRARLPDYMVPTAWVTMPALPLNANGKIDRKALPEPQARGQDSVHVEPVSDTEKLIARIWSELFKVERIGLNDNFFALGGHSMLAVQLLWLVEQRAGVHVAIRGHRPWVGYSPAALLSIIRSLASPAATATRSFVTGG